MYKMFFSVSLSRF